MLHNTPKANRQKTGYCLLSFLACFTLYSATAIYALTTDKLQPCFIQADSATFNSHTGITHYVGHVIADQGSTHLTAQTLITYQNHAHHIIRSVASGQPANYSTLPDHSQTRLYMHAKSMVYYPSDAILKLTHNSVVEHKGATLKGDQIRYNVHLEQVMARNTVKTPHKTEVIIPPGG